MLDMNGEDTGRDRRSSQPGNLGVYDTKIRVLIVDDHPLMRQMLSEVLAADTDIEVVAQAADGEQALQLVKEVRPDVMVLDFAMPGANGIEVMRALRKQRSLPVLMVSVHPQPLLVQQAWRGGAQGYLPKLAVARSLAPAIRAVCEGRLYCGEDSQWFPQA